MAKGLGRTSLTGGGSGALDAVDGNRLSDGDVTLVVDSSKVFRVYRTNGSSSAAESSPEIITPDTNAGTKRHMLAGTNVDHIISGPSAPALRFKKLSGTTASAEGGTATVAHGLTHTKIIGVQVLVHIDATTAVCHGFTTTSELEYDVYFNNTNVAVVLHATNSGSILSKSFTALITYEV